MYHQPELYMDCNEWGTIDLFLYIIPPKMSQQPEQTGALELIVTENEQLQKLTVKAGRQTMPCTPIIEKEGPGTSEAWHLRNCCPLKTEQKPSGFGTGLP